MSTPRRSKKRDVPPPLLFCTRMFWWTEREKIRMKIAIHQHIPLGTLPIIFTSATSQSELSDLQAQLPTVTFLRQPFHVKDLLALIERRALSPTPCSV